jgi:hypothetical protein
MDIYRNQQKIIEESQKFNQPFDEDIKVEDDFVGDHRMDDIVEFGGNLALPKPQPIKIFDAIQC